MSTLRVDTLQTTDSSFSVLVSDLLQAAVVADLPETLVLNQAKSGNFWLDVHPDVHVHRVNDRVFMGAATVNDGRHTNVTKDWLETERVNTTNNSTFTVLSTIGQSAATFGSRTSDINLAGGMGCIGGQFWALNDNTAFVQSAYALYGEARRRAGAGTTHGFEFDIVNQGSLVPIQPYQISNAGLTAAAWLASGGELAANSASAAMAVINNGAAFLKGIVFQANALSGCDGVTGSAPALTVAKGHTLEQVFAGGSLGSAVSFDVSNAAAQQTLVFSDVGLLYRNAVNANLFQVGVSNTLVNGLKVNPGNAGTGVQLTAQGPDANIDLILTPQGAGLLNISNAPVVGTAGAQAGYIHLKVNGTAFRIPLYNAA